jgi:tetratricopeptide (TPR) repeat protein
VQFEYLPTLRALSAPTQRAPLDAVEHLERARPYDLALPGTAFFAKFGGLYPAYIRGESYLAAGRGQEAAVEFQKVLNHCGIVFADPIGALAHLQLGRAYVASGDVAKAKNAYQDFLTSGKMPTRTSPSSNRPGRNTPGCAKQSRMTNLLQFGLSWRESERRGVGSTSEYDRGGERGP